MGGELLLSRGRLESLQWPKIGFGGEGDWWGFLIPPPAFFFFLAEGGREVMIKKWSA